MLRKIEINKITDFCQGIFNCPPDLINSGHCSYCPNVDSRPDNIRQFLNKPRCPEPNFYYFMRLKGVNDKGFDHENIRPLLYFHLNKNPEYFCVCGNDEFKIIFKQKDKFSFPIAELLCKCGRQKIIIIHSENLYLGDSFKKRPLRRRRYEEDKECNFDKVVKCRCGNQGLIICYNQRGFEFYPQEGPIIALGCKKCNRSKKINIKGVDDTEPWLKIDDSIDKEKITVFSDVSQYLDLTKEQKTIVALVKPPPLNS